MSDQPDKPGLTIVKLGEYRQEKQEAKAGETVRVPGVHTSIAEYSTEVVQLIGCTNCHSPAFKLAHDGRVICAVCSVQIMSLRWHDINVSTVVPRSPA